MGCGTKKAVKRTKPVDLLDTLEHRLNRSGSNDVAVVRYLLNRCRAAEFHAKMLKEHPTSWTYTAPAYQDWLAAVEDWGPRKD